jgi:hypothetical protein
MTMAEPDPPLALDRPPFVVDGQLSPAQTAQAFEACFRTVSAWPDRVSDCHALLAAMLPEDASASALREAGAKIAADMDRGLGSDDALPYHNRQHFCEVMLSAHFVGLLSGLGQGERAELLFAALIHDFGHDGGTNEGCPFRLERRALDLAAPYLAAVQIDERIARRLAAAVLATEISVGLPRARAWYRRHFLDGGQPAGAEPVPEFEVFSREPAAARIAVALAEADAIGSVGLSRAHADLQQERLAREWGRPLGPSDKRHYLDRMFGEFLLARYFAPNLEAIRNET